MRRLLICLLLILASARVRMSWRGKYDLIPGARVTLSGPGLQTRVVTTDEHGRYRFLGRRRASSAWSGFDSGRLLAVR